MENSFSFVDLRKSNRYDIAFRMGIGRRDSQQDAGFVAACDNETLAVVCDGMGGLTGGERASKAAIEKFLSEYEREGRLDGADPRPQAGGSFRVRRSDHEGRARRTDRFWSNRKGT